MSNFSLPWNTATSPNGPHTIYAVVTDFSGNTVTTSTINVTVLNDEPAPPDTPPTPTPPPVVVPQTTTTEPIPLGALFYNTLGEFSTFIAQAVFPSATDPDASGNFTDDWIDVVRDLGVVGDGSDETEKVQTALDQARDNVIAGAGKTRVLIPSSVVVSVAPVENDLCDGSYYNSVGVCLWIDSGVHFRVNGVLKARFGSIQTYSNGQITILEARNSFVGAIDSGDHDIVIDGTGTIDLEGIYDTNGEFTDDETESLAKQIKSLWALRAYKVSKLTVKDLTIAHGIGEKFQIGFSEFVNFDNVKFDTALRYEVSNEIDTALINLDVCRGVHVTGCYSKNCSIYRGVACWASTEVTIDGNDFSDLTGATGAEIEEVDVGVSRIWDGSVSNYIKLTGQGLFNGASCQCAWIEPASIGVLGTILGNRFDSGYSMRITAANELELFWSTEPLVAGNWTDYSLKVPLTTAGGASSNFLVAGRPLFVAINVTFSGAPVIADFYAGFTPGSVQLLGTVSGGHAIAPNGTIACGIGVNMYGLTPQHAFNGKLARIAVITRALTVSELRAFAACGALPPDADVAITRFFLEITGDSPEPNNYGTSIPGTVVGSLPIADGLCGNVDDLTTPGIGTAVWFTDYGMEFIEKDMAYDEDIYDLDAGLDSRLKITNNTFCRNGSDGIRILGAAQQGTLTDSVTIVNNTICSNGASGILIDGLKDFIINDNQIKNNGHGYPLQFD